MLTFLRKDQVSVPIQEKGLIAGDFLRAHRYTIPPEICAPSAMQLSHIYMGPSFVA
jgi:hypothetical protein